MDRHKLTRLPSPSNNECPYVDDWNYSTNINKKKGEMTDSSKKSVQTRMSDWKQLCIEKNMQKDKKKIRLQFVDDTRCRCPP